MYKYWIKVANLKFPYTCDKPHPYLTNIHHISLLHIHHSSSSTHPAVLCSLCFDKISKDIRMWPDILLRDFTTIIYATRLHTTTWVIGDTSMMKWEKLSLDSTRVYLTLEKNLKVFSHLVPPHPKWSRNLSPRNVPSPVSSLRAPEWD